MRMSPGTAGDRVVELLTELFDGEVTGAKAGDVTTRITKAYNFAFQDHDVTVNQMGQILIDLGKAARVELDRGDGNRYIYRVKVITAPKMETVESKPEPAVDPKLANRIGSIEMQLLDINRKLDKLLEAWT